MLFVIIASLLTEIIAKLPAFLNFDPDIANILTNLVLVTIQIFKATTRKSGLVEVETVIARFLPYYGPKHPPKSLSPASHIWLFQR